MAPTLSHKNTTEPGAKLGDKEKRRVYYAKNRDKLRERQREYRAKNPNKVHCSNVEWRKKNPTHDHDYYMKNREKILSKKREYSKNYAKQHPEKSRIRRNQYRQRNPEKTKTQRIAQANISLANSCVKCGSKENLERHHPDYSKPLEIITLCHTCHGLIHRKTEVQFI